MEKEKRSFKDKVVNIWYYYKIHLIVGLFIVVVLGFVIGTSINTYNPDANILYIGGKSFNVEDSEYIIDTIEQRLIGADYNKNGKIEADMLILNPIANGKDEYGDPNWDPDFYSKFEQEINTGDTVILIIENKAIYEMLMLEDLLVPLADILGETPANANDPFSMKLGDLDMSKLDGIKLFFSKEALVCVRQPRVVNGITDDRAKKLQEYNESIFKDMLGYRFHVSDQM